MAIYPTAVPDDADYPDRTNDVDIVLAARYNEIKNEVLAICLELGISPSGASADVVTRLALLALKTNVLELDNVSAFTPDADYEPATKKYVDDNEGISDIIEDTTPQLGGDLDLNGHAIEQSAQNVDINIKINDGGTQRTAIQVHGDEGSVSFPRQSLVDANISADVNIFTGTSTIMIFNTENTDVLGEYNNSTGVFTAKTAGNYLVVTSITWQNTTPNKSYITYIYKNETAMISNRHNINVTASRKCVGISSVIPLSIDDEITVRVYQDSGGTDIIDGISPHYTHLVINKVS